MKLKHLSLLTFIIALLMLVTTTVKAAGFNVTRTVTNTGLPVTNTFTYTVTNGTGNPATVTIPGTTTIAFSGETPNSSCIASKSASPLISSDQWTGAANWPGTSTKLSYTKPGTYTFIVTETSSNNTLYPRDTNTYTVTVFVENNLDANNSPTGTFTITYIGSQKNGTGSKINASSASTYTSAANRSSIQLTKTVTGNLADKNKYFITTLALSSGDASSTYTVRGSAYSNPNISTNSSGAASGTINIKHGETVTIGLNANGCKEIKKGATYTFTEDATSASGYTVYVDGSSSASSTRATASKTVGTNDSSQFKNHREGTAPTGIIIRTLPFLVLIALSVVGIVAIAKTRKLEEEQDIQ